MKSKVRSRLGEIIEAKGLKMKWVAEQIEATQSQVTNWCKNEKGYANSTPNVVYILKLQRVLGVSVEEMFEEVEIEQ
ncbi:hypothetical protein FZC79_10535 [Rossellomorea vietnamensis]|uniref:XRE family transcriptional regulator n=1 Tax=Rossellomorea vietnamensis TaxID=218284 RepID=A0A5D4KFT7_9BACI|nr:hypothetical protein [Rossellomorea vietnamensis]TYR75595.1 hypothetical protein FZC79_10535 [Rossellomorea vietnamensis]